MYVKFVMGLESLDNFEAFRDQLRKMGVENYLSIAQTALDNYNAWLLYTSRRLLRGFSIVISRQMHLSFRKKSRIMGRKYCKKRCARGGASRRL